MKLVQLKKNSSVKLNVLNVLIGLSLAISHLLLSWFSKFFLWVILGLLFEYNFFRLKNNKTNSKNNKITNII